MTILQVSKQSGALSDDIERLRTEVEDLEKLTDEARKKNQEAWDRSAQFNHVIESLNANTKQHQWLQDQMELQKRELKVRPESDEWLQNELDQYEERVRVREDQQQQKTNNYEQLRRTIDSARASLERKQNEAGRYENAQITHEEEVEARKTLIRESARRHNIRGYDTDLDDMQISEYMEKISKLYKDQSANVERVRRETEKEMQKVQEVLSSLVERKSGLHEGKSSAKQQSSANDKKIASFQLELDHVEIDEGAKALSESNVREIDQSLKQAKDEYEQSQWDANISHAKTQLRTAEEDVEQTSQELVQNTKKTKDLARLEHLKKELSDRKRSLETLTGAHNERFRSIVGTNWDVTTLERDFHSVLEQRSEDLRDFEGRRTLSFRDLEQTEFKLRSCRDALRKAEKEVQECARNITNATEEELPDSYPAYVEQLQKDRDMMEADVNNFSNLKKFWNKSIRTAKDKGHCELCERQFHGESEKSAFIRKMEAMIADKVHGGLKDSKNDLANLEELLRKTRAVSPNYNTWQRLSSSELPRLQSELQQLEQAKATQVRKGEDYDKEVADREDSKKAVESLSKPVSIMANLQTDITQFTKQIEELSAAQKDAGFSRTIDEIQEQLESLKGQARARRSLVDKLTAERQQAQSQISRKELKLSNAKNELSVATHQLEKKLELGKRIEDLRNSNREHRETMRQLDSQIDGLSPQMSAQETKLRDIRQRGFKREQELQQEASKLSDSVHNLRSADRRSGRIKTMEGPRVWIDADGRSKTCSRNLKGWTLNRNRSL